MPRIRNKHTGHEVSVPDVKAALPNYPDYEPVEPEVKPSGEESTAKTTQRSKS